MTLLTSLFTSIAIIGLIIDLLFSHGSKDRASWSASLKWSLFWIALAFAFGFSIYIERGYHLCMEFMAAYLVEKSLSLDNLFIFYLIFQRFGIELQQSKRILIWGVLTAVIARAILLFLGLAAIAKFHFMLYLMGAFLVFSGFKLCLQEIKRTKSKQTSPYEQNKGSEAEIQSGLIEKILQKLPAGKQGESNALFNFSPTFSFTKLGLALVTIELTDLVFALDSIPAVLAITTDPFIAYSSNLFAILGLRSLYFLLYHLFARLYYLQVAISLLLIFIGVKLMIGGYIEISSTTTLVFTFTCFIMMGLANYFRVNQRESSINSSK